MHKHNIIKIKDGVVSELRKIGIAGKAEAIEAALTEFESRYGLAAIRLSILIYKPSTGQSFIVSPALPSSLFGGSTTVSIPLRILDIYHESYT